MRKQKNNKFRLPDIVTLALLFLFVYTASGKLSDHSAFYSKLILFPFIKSYAFFISWGIPLTELLIATLLILPSKRITGLYGSVFILILFSVYILLMIRNGGRLPCSCGGVIEYFSWTQHFLFNLFFIALTVIAIRLERKRPLPEAGKTNNRPV
ncbi:MAG TPA: MauE/DoxX family redox-associated membrane protein [Puia sp.]